MPTPANVKVGQSLRAGFLLSLILLATVAAVSLICIQSLFNSARLVDHSNKVITTLESAMSVMKDAETGQRGYLLTGDGKFLAPYNGSFDKEANIVADFRRLTADNPRQQQNAVIINNIITTRLDILKRHIEKKRGGSVITTADLDTSKRAMDALRAAVDKAESVEKGLLNERLDRLHQYNIATPIFL